MGRKQRRFTAEDIERIACRNLTEFELAKFKSKVSFGLCQEPNEMCDTLKIIYRRASIICDFADSSLVKFFSRYPIIRAFLKAVKIMCEALPVLELYLDVYCSSHTKEIEGGDGIGNSIPTQESTGEERTQIENTTGSGEIENQTGDTSDEEETKMIEYTPQENLIKQWQKQNELLKEKIKVLSKEETIEKQIELPAGEEYYIF